MNYYTPINPSDGYTLKATDAKTAIIVSALLGGGRYGLEDEAGETVMPIFIIDGFDEWIAAEFGCDTKDFFDQADWGAIADCFDSVAIVNLTDRKLYEEALEAMQEPARSAWKAKWHDKHRSSMNDIGARAAKGAERARAKVATA